MRLAMCLLFMCLSGHHFCHVHVLLPTYSEVCTSHPIMLLLRRLSNIKFFCRFISRKKIWQRNNMITYYPAQTHLCFSSTKHTYWNLHLLNQISFITYIINDIDLTSLSCRLHCVYHRPIITPSLSNSVRHSWGYASNTRNVLATYIT